MSDKMILNTSDEAAKLTTVTGWVSRDGLFYGNDERGARWSGCTHVACSNCGEPTNKSWTKCQPCRDKQDREKYASLPRVEWDGSTPLFSHERGEYAFSADDVQNWLDDDLTLEQLRLVVCEPVFARMVDDDYWECELPEDQSMRDVNGDIADAIDALNEEIDKARKGDNPLSWQPGKHAAVVTLPLFSTLPPAEGASHE